MTLTEFLAARLDEDEAVATAALASVLGIEGELADAAAPCIGDAGYRHIKLHDPARVLREVAAGRAILAEHAPDAEWPDICQRCITDRKGYPEQWKCDRYPCRTLQVLAAVWSDHPDYDQAWARA